MRILKCPSCGAALTIQDDNREFAFCEYCGAKFSLDDLRITHRIVDEARIKETEANKEIKLKQLELENLSFQQSNKTNTFAVIVWIAISLFLIIIGGILTTIETGEASDAGGYMFLFGILSLFLGAMIILLNKAQKKQNKKNDELLEQGGIIFPDSLSSLNYPIYPVAYQILKECGFNNIHCINMHDIKFMSKHKENEIDSITVNGELGIRTNVYLPDSKIIITYHGK